jgi:preprotein translocase subunit YajC
MHALSIIAQEEKSGSGGSSFMLLFFALIAVVMYFLLIRPQRKRMKAQSALQAAIGVGDEVVTNSGIYGFVTGVDDDKFWLEIDDDVQIRIAKAAIQGRVKPTAGDDDDPADGRPGKADESGDPDESDES